jgi:hypothetical protein
MIFSSSTYVLSTMAMLYSISVELGGARPTYFCLWLFTRGFGNGHAGTGRVHSRQHIDTLIFSNVALLFHAGSGGDGLAAKDITFAASACQ